MNIASMWIKTYRSFPVEETPLPPTAARRTEKLDRCGDLRVDGYAGAAALWLVDLSRRALCRWKAAGCGRFGARWRRGFVARSIPVALLALAASTGAVHSAAPIELPVRTVAGDDLRVPAALPAGAFVIVGFKRRSLNQTGPWREAVEALGASAPPVFSLYVLEAAPRWVRWMIVRTTKREASPEKHGSILVAAQDEVGWRSLVGFQAAREDAAYVVRFDASGQPCFRYAGPVTEEALQSGLVADCAF